jgi:hypothetical protein
MILLGTVLFFVGEDLFSNFLVSHLLLIISMSRHCEQFPIFLRALDELAMNSV